MTIKEIRHKASAMGLKGISRMRKHELVRHIQQKEGYTPCFGGIRGTTCTETSCCWRFDCLRNLESLPSLTAGHRLSA
ncbi:MAG: hypothetical protein C0624_06560 [Desulfuromonas sp.]|nr:MAG: hypothetical protein C0624_06560 [Desulfuromonas sp.]